MQIAPDDKAQAWRAYKKKVPESQLPTVAWTVAALLHPKHFAARIRVLQTTQSEIFRVSVGEIGKSALIA
jgi:phospholipase C